MTCEMGKQWPCKPREEWPDERFEDLYHCHGCDEWLPRWHFEKGFMLHRARMSPNKSLGKISEELLKLDGLQRCLDEGAVRWQCDNCFVTTGLI